MLYEKRLSGRNQSHCAGTARPERAGHPVPLGPAMRRREFLLAAGPAIAMLGGGSRTSRWNRAAYRKPSASRVVVSRAESYESPLIERIVQGRRLCGVDVDGRSGGLKPDTVAFGRGGSHNRYP